MIYRKVGGADHISQLVGIEGTFAHIPNIKFRIPIPDFDLDLGYLVTETYALLFQVCIKHLRHLLSSDIANFLSSRFQRKTEVISLGEGQHMFRWLITQLQQLTICKVILTVTTNEKLLPGTKLLSKGLAPC